MDSFSWNLISNLQLRQKANILAEMQVFLQKRQEEEDRVKIETEDLNRQLTK